MKCPYYMKKVGGYNYGWKCEAYHGGDFVLYSNGDKIEYNPYSRTGAELNKEGRDRYVKEKCLSNCNGCTLYQSVIRNS